MDLTFGCVLLQAAYGPIAGPMAIRTLAQRAETLGFHTIWFADHIVIPRHVKPFYPYEAGGASPFEIAGDLGQYQALGIRNFNVNLPGADIVQQSEAMDQFMREVVPLVA